MTDTKSASPSTRRREPAILLACSAQFLSALNMGVAPLMIPPLAADLGFGQTSQAWVVSGYALAFAGFVLLGGRLADIFGGGRMLTIGYIIATLSAVLAACSPSTAVLIGARIAQGAGAAVTVPAALAIIAATREDLSGRSRALAAFAGSGAAGFGLGLAAGGLAADTVGWRWLFGALGAVSALLAVLTFILAKRQKRKPGHVSVGGGMSSAAGFMLVAYAVTIGSSEGIGLFTVAIAASGLCLLGLFLWSQTRSRSPIMPVEIWSRPRFALNVTSTTLLYGAWVSTYYFAALVLQEVIGLSGTEAALVMAPLALGAALGSRIAGMVLPRVSRPTMVILFGSVVCAVAIALLALPALSHPWAMVLVLGLVVGGQTTAFVAQNVAILSVAVPGEIGLAGSLFNAGCQLGGGFAVAGLAAFSQAFAGPDVADGYRAAFLGAAALALLAGIVVCLPHKSRQTTKKAIAPVTAGTRPQSAVSGASESSTPPVSE